MVKLFSVLFFVLIFAVQLPGQELKKVWETDRSLKVPESITYDAQRDILFVSNINGSPLEKDGNGFISKVSSGGSIENLEWATGLNAPKGSAISEDKFYVTDIDELVVIDIKTGYKISSYVGAEAIFLNDVAIDQAGYVYVSDYSEENSALYRLKDDKFEIWIKNNEIGRPNGLYIHKNELYVGNSADGKIKAIDLENESIRTVAVVGSGIDGLKMDDEGNFIVSDWVGKTSFVSKNGEVTELLNTTDQKINSADLEFVIEKNLLIIPTFIDNRLVAYELMK
jgi:sugar lactone lactonase YvrE